MLLVDGEVVILGQVKLFTLLLNVFMLLKLGPPSAIVLNNNLLLLLL